MVFTINELSLERVASDSEATNVLLVFADVSRALVKAGFSKIKLWDKSAFLEFELATNFKVIEWIKTNHKGNKEKTQSQFLKSLLTKTSLFNWTEEERKILQDIPIVGLEFNGQQLISEGLKFASLNGSIAISLATNQFWNCAQVQVLYIEENGSELIEQTISVNHASQVDHLHEQNNWIQDVLRKRLSSENWKPKENYFPNLSYSNLLVPEGNWQVFQDQKKQADSANPKDEIRALILTYGQQVAERNCYKLDVRLSALNSTETKKRKIFYAGVGRDRIYLSLDLETGAFEVCDYKGDHLGEYFFDGQINKEAEKGHGIKVKS